MEILGDRSLYPDNFTHFLMDDGAGRLHPAQLSSLGE